MAQLSLTEHRRLKENECFLIQELSSLLKLDAFFKMLQIVAFDLVQD